MSPELRQLIQQQTAPTADAAPAGLNRIGGRIAVHSRINLSQGKVLEAATAATPFKSYESLLLGRDLKQVGAISAMASGLCGGVHATASALCLEMALGLRPPPLGICLRNLLLSCQYLNDNSMHLFVLAGPDYSQAVVERHNPEIWQQARNTKCHAAAIHGYRRISDLLTALNKDSGDLYREAKTMAGLARQAYSLLGGKYPHSETIVPGGVTLTVDANLLQQFRQCLHIFAEFSRRAASIWDDVFDFLLAANPRYEAVGQAPASLLDFGQWDHPEHYDASYQNCNAWGQARWSTPAALIDGKLQSTQLAQLNAGLQESHRYSFQSRSDLPETALIRQDPLGNPLAINHPWNKSSRVQPSQADQAYSWGSHLSWQGQGFEVGAYARLYLSAAAQALPPCPYLNANGCGLSFEFPLNQGEQAKLSWPIPRLWNAFERNRARAYALAYSYAVTLHNLDIAESLLSRKENTCLAKLPAQPPSGQRLGVGLWGASRGFLAHWAVLNDGVIENYQMSIPSRVNAGTRASEQQLGPIETALRNTPIIESRVNASTPFRGIDIQRTIQSFDPCMPCTSQVYVEDRRALLNQVIETL